MIITIVFNSSIFAERDVREFKTETDRSRVLIHALTAKVRFGGGEDDCTPVFLAL